MRRTGNAISEPAIGMVVPATVKSVFVRGPALVAVAQPATAPVVIAAAACSAPRRVIVLVIDFMGGPSGGSDIRSLRAQSLRRTAGPCPGPGNIQSSASPVLYGSPDKPSGQDP